MTNISALVVLPNVPEERSEQGSKVGITDGEAEGRDDGLGFGCSVGSADGDWLGIVVGATDGS